MPPKVGSRRDDVDQLVRIAVVISMSNTSMPANFWNRRPCLPSRLCQRPMSPRPRTAVPLLITATRLPRAVSSLAALGSATIASQA
jgi:hypothetical protein